MNLIIKPLWTFRVLLVMFMVVAAGSVHAKKVGSVTLDEKIVLNDTELFLNGAGLRKKLFIKLYVGSLYLAQSLKGSDADTIIKADEPMLIKLDILSELLTRDKLIKALDDGFNKSTNGNIAPIQEQISAMKEALSQPVRPGDIYQIMYVPDVGTHLIVGDQILATLDGLAYKQAVFGIWLSESPAQKSLKEAMLGS